MERLNGQISDKMMKPLLFLFLALFAVLVLVTIALPKISQIGKV